MFRRVGSFRNCADVVYSDSTCKVWEGWLSAVWAIGFSDWLCASCMTILIGSVLVNQRGVWEGGILCALCFSMHSIPSSPVFMFWSTCSVINCYCKWRLLDVVWWGLWSTALCFSSVFMTMNRTDIEEKKTTERQNTHPGNVKSQTSIIRRFYWVYKTCISTLLLV